MIKAVVLEQKHGRIEVRRAGLAGTPAGVLTEGVLTDGIAIARSVRGLSRDYSMQEKSVAAAIGGERVLCRSEEAPSGRSDNLAEFVRERVAQLAPYPIDSAICVHQPVESVIAGSVLWAAASAERVDWIKETVSLAGKTATSVMPQSCALANAYSYNYEPRANSSALLVNIGARTLTLAAVRGWAVAWAQDSMVGSDWHSASENLPQRVSAELEQHWDSIQRAVGPEAPRTVYVGGGAARNTDVLLAIRERTRLQVEEIDPFRRIAPSPSSRSAKLIREHSPSLGIAVGLALASFESLP
jgi:Tfp pilus assembly PilM family ATPase